MRVDTQDGPPAFEDKLIDRELRPLGQVLGMHDEQNILQLSGGMAILRENGCLTEQGQLTKWVRRETISSEII